MKHLIGCILAFMYTSFVFANDSALLVIHFPFNKFELQINESKKIDSFIAGFDTTKFAIQHIRIEGHTDQVGSNSYNYLLSKKRAESVATTLAYLLNRGIDTTLSYFGKTQLLRTSNAEDERYFNRRVVVTIIYKPTVIKEIVTIKPDTTTQTTPVETKAEIINVPPAYKKLSEKISDSSLKIGDRIELPFILFVGGMHEFLPTSYPYLDELLNVMLAHPKLEIEIQGHICCQPGIEDGIDLATRKNDLSLARAIAVYDYLRKRGISKKRMQYVGLGHQFPITQEITEQEKTRNRRVEIKILKR